MQSQNEIIDDEKNGNMSITDVETFQTLNDGCMEDIKTENGNLSDLPLVTEATIPERKEPEKIEKLDLKYPTNHLKGFGELRTATRLHGHEYTIIEKAVWYGIHSGITPRLTLKLGQIETDGRIQTLILLMSGKGKGELKRVFKRTSKGLGKSVYEPTSFHPEQLVGKTVRQKNKDSASCEQFEGYLSRDILIVDEGKNLLTSKDPIHSESRRYLRLAQDSYPNEISKKPVDVSFENELRYSSYVVTCIFTQPYVFEEDFVTDGDLRRYLVPYVNMGGIDRSNAYKNRIFNIVDSDVALGNFINYLKSLPLYENFEVSNDAISYFEELSEMLINRGFSYSKKVHNFTQLNDFTIQDKLLKMSAVQAMQYETNTITKKHVALAFVDLLEILEHTYDFVTFKINGMMDYGDGWAGSVGKDRQILEWLYSTGATSENNSNISIDEYEKKIMEIWNVQDRRARTIKQEHESKGWIKSKKAPKISKVWVYSNTKTTQALPAIEARTIQKKYDEILKEIDSMTAYNASIAPNKNKEIPHMEAK